MLSLVDCVSYVSSLTHDGGLIQLTCAVVNVKLHYYSLSYDTGLGVCFSFNVEKMK